MYIKIYFDDKPLFLCDKIDPSIEEYVHHDDAVLIDELNTHSIKSMIHEMQKPSIHAGVFVHPDLEELKKAWWKKFTIIKAGGGLVVNEKGAILMIFRKGKWDLPKGKLDKNETIEDCAVREVEEETGLVEVQLKAPLLTTYHTYQEGSKSILKESWWFTMKAGGEQVLVPQTEEGIKEAKWVTPEQATALFPASFPSVVDVLKKYTGD